MIVFKPWVSSGSDMLSQNAEYCFFESFVLPVFKCIVQSLTPKHNETFT